MSGDLNEFLRQAALRREARKRQTEPQAAPVPSPPRTPAQARKISPQDDLQVLQPIPVEQRHVTPKIPSTDHLGGNAAKADQKREAHLRDVFGAKPAPLQRSQKKKEKGTSSQPTKKQPSSATPSSEQAAISALYDRSAASSDIGKAVSSLELIEFLRNPHSLKMAFIASEIFGRKFQ